MKNFMIIIPVVLFMLASCDIDQTKEAKLPDVDVDVDVDEGQLPKFDVDWADVKVGTRKTTVKIPKVVVVMEEEDVEIPYIDVDMPDEDKTEKNIVVAAEIKGEMHKLTIQKVYATPNKLIVISSLKSTGEDLQKKQVRVSDQLVINAPDLEVVHYIIGTKMPNQFNNQYRYIKSQSEISDKVKNGRLIYSS